MKSNSHSVRSGSQVLQDLELDNEQYQVLVEDVRQYCETRAGVLEMAKGTLRLIKVLGN